MYYLDRGVASLTIGPLAGVMQMGDWEFGDEARLLLSLLMLMYGWLWVVGVECWD